MYKFNLLLLLWFWVFFACFYGLCYPGDDSAGKADAVKNPYLKTSDWGGL